MVLDTMAVASPADPSTCGTRRCAGARRAALTVAKAMLFGYLVRHATKIVLADRGIAE